MISKVTFNFHNHLSATTIMLIIFIVLLMVLIIFFTVFLYIISIYKNKQLITFKNLQSIQNLTIKERLMRIKQMVQTNEQYKNILNIWISRYQLFLKKDLNNLIKDYLKVIKLQEKKAWLVSFKLMKKVHQESKILKHQMQLLTTEIDYFISIDLLQREYQLFFKQNFNYLQDEIVKMNLQNNLNHEQISEIIIIINDMFKELSINVNDANFSQVIKLLGEIAIAVVTLAEILANLPILNHLVTYDIMQKMQNLKNMCQISHIDNTLLMHYDLLENSVNEKVALVKKLINNLQYKKAKILIQEILKNITNFTSKINQEQIFRKFFQQNYEQFLVINFNFKDIFESIKLLFIEINKTGTAITNKSQITDLESIINKHLTIFNRIDNELIIENQKLIKTITYEQLLMLLRDLLENSLIVFNNLQEYNKLLQLQIKPQIQFDIGINKINSMMLQIDNILSNINYYYLNENYIKTFNSLQQVVINFTNQGHNNELKNEDILKINDLQNQIFQLYNQLKTEIIIHKLAHLTLIYANRHRKINNDQLKAKFNDIELCFNNNNHHQALTLLLELM